MAKAKYRNIADTPDELSFGQGDIVTILEKDYGGLDGWWLCQLHGEVGLVPANYFEIYNPDNPDSIPLYDFPPNNKEAPTNATIVLTSPASSPKRNSGGSPKVTEATLNTSARVVLYDIPPSETKARGDDSFSRSSPQFGARSSPQLGAKSSDTLHSSCSSIPLYDTPPASRKTSSSDPYDFPPDAKKEAIMKLYDTPRSNSPFRKDDLSAQQPDRVSIIPISMDCLFDEDADRLLESLHKEISTSYEELCECVYGPNAIWDKDRRQATLQRTINAIWKFDQCLVNFLEFGKGVSNVLETFKDTHLRMRFNESYSSLLQKRVEILNKFDLLVDGREIVDQITSTVKNLLEIAKTLPGAATELVVLIRANKTILFKQQPRPSRSTSSLPRPANSKNKSPTEHPKLSVARSISVADTSLDRKQLKRNPRDVLPPLPLEDTTPQEQNYNLLKAKAFAPLNKAHGLYEELKWDQQNERKPQTNGVHQSRDSHISLNSVGSENDETDFHGSNPAMSGDSESLDNGYFSFDHTQSLNRQSSPKPMTKEDQELMNVFAMQLDAMSLSLVDATDGFLRSIAEQGSPTNFVPQSKHTIVCAYKLVYVANTLFQKIGHGPTKSSIVAASNELVEAIKLVVSDTKTAALQHPNVQATERMMESVNHLNPVASDLVKVVRDGSSPSP